MTSYSQSNYYYKNENDALSCNSRPISSTLRKESSNNEFNSDIDIYESYGNTSIYDITNGSSERNDVIMQPQSYEAGIEVIIDRSDGNREYRNTFGSGINAQNFKATDTTTKSSASMATGNEYSALHVSTGYAINDNVSYPSQAYNSYASDPNKDTGSSSDDYSYNAATSYKVSELNKDISGHSAVFMAWENNVYNGESACSGKYSTLGSTKILPQLPTKANNSILDGMYAYMGGLEVQPQRDDAKQSLKTPSALKLQASVAARTPHYRMRAQMQALTAGYDVLCLNKFEHRNAVASTCITNRSRGDVVGSNEQHCSGTASWRLLPQLQSHQPAHVEVLKRQLFEGGNAGAISNKSTTTMLDNPDYTKYDNGTIRKYYSNNYDDNASTRRDHCGEIFGSGDTKPTYYASTVQRPQASMPPFDFREFNDYSGSYNNIYKSNTENLLTCSDSPAYTATQAQKLQLQQQRKYAIMMAMTTASVIASGETRVPGKRIIERPAKKFADDYDYIGIDSGLSERKNESDSSNKAFPKTITTGMQSQIIVDNVTPAVRRSTATTVVTSTAVKSNILLTSTAMATTTTAVTTNALALPTTLYPPTTARKLPKHLPTPKYNRDKNSIRRKSNGISKKLPNLPTDAHATDDNSNTAAANQNTERIATPIAVANTSIAYNLAVTTDATVTTTATGTTELIEPLSTQFDISSALPSLAIDVFNESKSVACKSPTLVSTSTYVASYSPPYLSYFSDTTKTTTIIDEDLPSTKPYTLTLNEKAATATTTIISVSTTTAAVITPMTTTVSSLSRSTEILKANNADRDVVAISTGTVAVTTTCKSSYSSNFIIYNNNNLNDEASYSNNITHLNNNNVITSLRTATSITPPARKTSIKTITPAYSESLLTSELPFYLKHQTTNSSSSNSTAISAGANLYASILPPTSSFSFSSPSISMPLYTCTILPPTLATVSVNSTTSSWQQTATTTSPTPTTIAFMSTDQSSIMNSPKFSYCGSGSESSGGIIAISNAFGTSSDSTFISSNVIGNNVITIFDEYLKGDDDSYYSFTPPITAPVIAMATPAVGRLKAAVTDTISRSTLTSPEPENDSLFLTSLMNSKSKALVTTAGASFPSPISTLKTPDKASTSLKGIVLLSTMSSTPPDTLPLSAMTTEITNDLEKSSAIATSKCTTNYFANYPLSLITATSANSISDSKSGQLVTTTIELTKIATTVTASAIMSCTDTTTPTSYVDYLTQYQLPAVISTSVTTELSPYITNTKNEYSLNNNVGIANDIKPELPTYITHFLDFDKSKSNIADILGEYDTSSFSYIYNSFDIYGGTTTAITTTTNTTSKTETSLDIGTTTLVTATENGPTTVSTSTSARQVSDAFPVTTIISAVAARFAINSGVLSMPNALETTDGGDEKCVAVTPTTAVMTPSATSLSLASAFDDNFYDSYKVDWTELTAPVAERSDMLRVTTAMQVAEDSSSYNDSATTTPEVMSTSSMAATTAISAATTITGSFSIGGGSTQGGYYCPTLVATNADAIIRKPMVPSATGKDTPTTTSAPLGVTGKATSMFGDISKGLKGGFDGVFSGVNSVAATADTNVKQQTQHSAKKSGFGFSLASKFVPNVGGLLAGATAAVQQTGVIKPANSDPFTTSSITATEIATQTTTATTKVTPSSGLISHTSTTTTATNATAISSSNLYTVNAIEDGISSRNSNGIYSNSTALTIDGAFQQTCRANSNQFSDPMFTNSTNHLEPTSYDVSGNTVHGQQMHIQSDDMMLNVMYIMRDSSVDSASGKGDEIKYMQQQPQSLAEVSRINSAIVGFNGHIYDEEYDAGDVADVNLIVGDEYGFTEYDEYAAELIAGDDIYNVTYAENIADGMHIVEADDSMVNTTAMFNDNMMTTYYHPQQQISNERLAQQKQGTKFQNSISLTKKATSSLLPSITNFAAQLQTQRPRASANSNNEIAPLSPSATTTSAKFAGGGGGVAGGMFGSFLGKAASAVQSATHVVNQATTAVQQKTATSAAATAASTVITLAGIMPTTTVATAAATDGYALMHNNDYNIHQQQEQQKLLLHQNSMSSQYSATTPISLDYENSNVYHYKNTASINGTATTTVTDTASQQYTILYLNGNQSQLQQQQSGKLLPTVPPAVSTGKKLPTINTSKSGFLIKQQPTEIYDDDLIGDDVNDANGYHLVRIDNERDEIVEEINDNELDNVDDGELDRYIVDDRIGGEQSHEQQRLRQIKPNYDIDSEQANYYMDPQLQTTPSDAQEKLSRRLTANCYYEHTNGGYDYREDYFNEEDEYKYLEKEQELLYKQQQKLLKQKQQQHSYQLDDSSDVYLEENYQSEGCGNYLDESSSGSVVVAAANVKTNKQAIDAAEQQLVMENATMTNDKHATRSSTTVISHNVGGVTNGNAPHQNPIKKQDSIIIEENKDEILFTEVGVSNSTISKAQHSKNSRRPSHDSMIENEDDTMSELPILSIATKKKILMRGETEEMVPGHMHMLRKPEVTAKQRWHWAYNKIIIQLNAQICAKSIAILGNVMVLQEFLTRVINPTQFCKHIYIHNYANYKYSQNGAADQNQQLQQNQQQDMELRQHGTSAITPPQRQQPQQYQEQQCRQQQQERHNLKTCNNDVVDNMSADLIGTTSPSEPKSMNVSELHHLQSEQSIKFGNIDSKNALKQTCTSHQIAELYANLQSSQHSQQKKRQPLQKVLLASKPLQQKRNGVSVINSNHNFGYNHRKQLGDYLANINGTNYNNGSSEADTLNKSKPHYKKNIGEIDSIDTNLLSEINGSNSLTTAASVPHAGSMVSITSEQQLCQLYNSQQHSDYIISDYMEKIATRISLLETELKFAWRALDLLSGEYGKIWARLEKLEKVSIEQQSVVSNLMGFIALKQERQQHQRLKQNQQHAPEFETHLDFIDTNTVGEQLRSPFDYFLRDEQLLMSNLVEAEQQAIILNHSAAALLQDIDMEGTSKQYSILLQELKNDTLDALDAVRVDSELDALNKLLQQQTDLTYGEGVSGAVSCHFEPTKPSYLMYSQSKQDNFRHFGLSKAADGVNTVLPQLAHHGELSSSLSTLSDLEKRKTQQVLAPKPSATIAQHKLFSDSDILLYEQQQMQANNAKAELRQQLLNSRQKLDKLTAGVVGDICSDRLQQYRTSDAIALLETASGSMQSLPFSYETIFATTRTAQDSSLPKAQSLAHISPQIFSDLPPELTLNLYKDNESCVSAGNVNDTDTPLSDFVQQVKFFRQAASKHSEGRQLDVPIEDSGGTSDRTASNIGNNSEMNEEFYKKLNEACRDNSLTAEISNVERLLQQSETTHEYVLGGLGPCTNSVLDMICEDNEEASEVPAHTVIRLADNAVSVTSKSITTTPSSIAKNKKDSKKQKKKKHHKDEMEMLNNLKSALVQAVVTHTTAVNDNINTPTYASISINLLSNTNAAGPKVGDRRSTASSYEEECSAIRTQFHGQDHSFPQLSEDKTALLDSTGEILLMEINKIQDLQVLNAAQIHKLRQLVKKEHAFFEKIHQVNQNLLLLLLNPATMSEEMRALANDKQYKFETVMNKLVRNIDTLKKLVGNSFDDYKRKYLTEAELTSMKVAADKEEPAFIITTSANKIPKKDAKANKATSNQPKISQESNTIDDAMVKKDKFSECSSFDRDINAKKSTNNKTHFDYSAHLIRNNSNFDEQLKILDTKELEMRLKKFLDPYSSAIGSINNISGCTSTHLQQPFTSSINTHNYLADMDTELEPTLLQTSRGSTSNRPSESYITQSFDRASSEMNLYNNDEYIKSLKRSLERHNSMLFLLHLQHPDHQQKTNAYQNTLAVDIDGILLTGVGGSQSPPPPAPNDSQPEVPNVLSGVENAVDDSLTSIRTLNPFYQQVHVAVYSNAYPQIQRGSPKQTKSDSGLSSMSGVSSWEKSPNSPMCCGSIDISSSADICNPFISKCQGIDMNMQLLMLETIPSNNNNNSDLDSIGLITNRGGEFDLGSADSKLMTTPRAITIATACSVIPTILSSTISAFSNTSDKIKQRLPSQFQHQIPQPKQLHQVQQEQQPQATEKDYMFSEENLNYIRELSKNMPICSVYENKSIFNILQDDTVDENIRTVDEMLAWDQQQQQQQKQQNLSTSNTGLVDRNRRIPDLLRTPVHAVSSEGSRDVPAKLNEATATEDVESRETPTRKPNLTDHLVYYPTSNEIADYNIDKNLNYLNKNHFDYRRLYQHQQLQQHHQAYRCATSLGYADASSSPIESPQRAPQHQQLNWSQTQRLKSPATYELYNQQMQERNNLLDYRALMLKQMPPNSHHLVESESPIFLDPHSNNFRGTVARDGTTVQNMIVSSTSANAVGMASATSSLSITVNSTAAGGQSVLHKPPNVWNKLTNLLPENFKLKRSSRYGRSRSLPTGYYDDACGSKILSRGQAGSYPSFAGHITPSIPNSHIESKRRDAPGIAVYEMTASALSTARQQRGIKHLGGSFDSSKRFHKLPLQLVQRATHPGTCAVASTSTSSAAAATGLTSGASIKKTIVGKGRKTRSRLSVTVNNFMQKAKTYRRQSFVARGGSAMAAAAGRVSDTEADLPSFTSSDNEGSIESDLGELSTAPTNGRPFDENDFAALVGYKTQLQNRERQHLKKLHQQQQQIEMKLFKKQVESREGDEEDDHEEDVPSYGEVGGMSDYGKRRSGHQENVLEEDIDAMAMSMFPQMYQLGHKESSETAQEKEVVALQLLSKMPKQKFQLNMAIDMVNLLSDITDNRGQTPHGQEKEHSDLRETNDAVFILASTKELILDSRPPAKTLLHKRAPVYADDEEFHYSGRSAISGPKMTPASLLSADANQSPQVVVTKINNECEQVNISTMHGIEYKLKGHGQRCLLNQQSLDIPAGGLHEEDDSRSQHSYRTLSSSRRQSTEDSIDTDDEYFCYELRQLEELEQQHKAECEAEAFAADPSVDNARLFSQIDQLAINSTTACYNFDGKKNSDGISDFLSDEYEPAEKVKQLMSKVLRELKYVVIKLPAVDDAKLETVPKAAIDRQNSQRRSPTKSSVTSFDRVKKVYDKHSAWQDVNGDYLQNNYSDPDAKEYADMDPATSDALEEDNALVAVDNIEYAARQLQQQTQHLVEGERVGPQKRFRKRRDRRRTNGNCLDSEVSHELHHSTSSSYSSEEDAGSATNRYKDKANAVPRRGSSSSEKHKRTSMTRVIPQAPEFHGEPAQNDIPITDERVVATDENFNAEELKTLSMSSGATLCPNTPAELSEEWEGNQRSYKTAPSYQAFKDNLGRTEIVTGDAEIVKDFQSNVVSSAQCDTNHIASGIDSNPSPLLHSETEAVTEIQTQPSKAPTRLISHDSSGEGSGTQVTDGNAVVLGSSKWKLLKTLKERKIEEKNNQHKIKDDELTKDRDKSVQEIWPTDETNNAYT